MDRAARPPTWFEELLEVLQARRRLAVVVAVAVALLGVLVAVIAPGILPPAAGVGAAVGVAACLLAVAAVVGVDAGDLRVRGARHVRAAGADVAVVLRGEPTGPGADAVVSRLDELGLRRVSFVPVSEAAHAEVVALVDGLGEAWARTGRRVLVLDLTRPDDAHAGIVDVARGEVPLGQAVRFDPDLMLARLGAGRDLESALVELPGLAPRLPTDIERMLVALPALSDPASQAGARALDDVLVVARAGRTSRVDLLATLEGLDVADVHAQVLLDRPEARAAVPAPGTPDAAPAVADDQPPTGLADDGAPHERTRDRAGEPLVAPPATDTTGGPRPALAARQRDEWEPDEPSAWGDPPPTDAHDEPTSGGSPEAAGDVPDTGDEPIAPPPTEAPPHGDDTWGVPRPPSGPQAGAGQLAGAAATGLLGLAEIEREIERGQAPAGRSQTPARLRAVAADDERVVPQPGGGLSSTGPQVADTEPEDADEAGPGGARPLRAVTPHDVDPSTQPFAVGAEVEPAPEAPDQQDDALQTAAVLETLAQEIWSRDDLGGTA